MNLTAMPRIIARRQYAAIRLPFTVVDQRVVASQCGEGASVRRGFELSLGWLDRFAGWLLADEQISRRGQAPAGLISCAPPAGPWSAKVIAGAANWGPFRHKTSPNE